jgi:type II secretory pathway pseudopilin PulG
MRSHKERRRRAQAGTTLIELLVSLMIIGLVVVVLVGSFSTALLDASLAKRNTAASAAAEYELEKIAASAFNSRPAAYSECFVVDTSTAPAPVGLGASCAAGTNVRADVSESDVAGGVQQWAILVRSYPALGQVGTTVFVYKVSR